MKIAIALLIASAAIALSSCGTISLIPSEGEYVPVELPRTTGQMSQQTGTPWS